MLKMGRYGIVFGRTFWLKTRVPTKVRRFLWFWFLKEARPSDVDKTQQYAIGEGMEFNGRRYLYWKAPKPVEKGEAVFMELEDR